MGFAGTLIPGRMTADVDRPSQSTTGRSPKRIRSFVLRQGRISPAQQRALEILLPKFGIPAVSAPIDFGAVFGRVAPVIVEIGFGMGDATAAIAKSMPECDFIGIEVHGPGVGSLLNRIEAEQLTNLRVIRHDAVEVLGTMVPRSTLAGIHVYFPDPWPKKRHHKRRLITPTFVQELAQRLKSGGYLHVTTDWQEYAQDTLAICSAEASLQNTTGGFAVRPLWRPQTKFEKRGLALGHAVFDILFRRR